jgi:hypothetical protein
MYSAAISFTVPAMGPAEVTELNRALVRSGDVAERLAENVRVRVRMRNSSVRGLETDYAAQS